MAVEDIVFDALVEEDGLLHYEADLAAQRLDVVLLDFNAVDEDLALLNVVEAEKEVGDGGLAAA